MFCRNRVQDRLISLVMLLNIRSKSRARFADGAFDGFETGVGVHKEYAINPLLFILKVKDDIQECRSDQWEILYVDYVEK